MKIYRKNIKVKEVEDKPTVAERVNQARKQKKQKIKKMPKKKRVK